MKINPWVHSTLIGFGVFNVAIGVTLFFTYPRIPFTVISPVIPQSLWASVFLATGLAMLYGLVTRKWSFLRYLMIFGFFVKVMWLIGLLFRLSLGSTPVTVELWGMIAYLQLLGVIYFNPENHYVTS